MACECLAMSTPDCVRGSSTAVLRRKGECYTYVFCVPPAFSVLGPETMSHSVFIQQRARVLPMSWVGSGRKMAGRTRSGVSGD
jgi:hypothetical protein